MYYVISVESFLTHCTNKYAIFDKTCTENDDIFVPYSTCQEKNIDE